MKLFDVSQVKLPKRKENTHKSHFGKVLIIAGSPTKWGAGFLSALSALRMGCGYVYWASWEDPSKIITQLPEVQTMKISHIKNFSDYDSILIGPGLSVGSKTKKLIQKLKNFKFVVVDADALTCLAQMNLKIPESWILTPHPGEACKLLKIKKFKQAAKERFRFAHEISKKYQCHILLKGHGSLVIFKKQIYKITNGNSALAKAGSGDVLSGILVSLLAQEKKPLKALLYSASFHGYLADVWVKKNSSRSMVPSDLVSMIPAHIRKFEK